MSFEEWWEREVSARRVDETDAMRDVAYAAWRAAFEAGKSCSEPYNEQHELLGIASELCYRVEADMPTLRDKFAMAALQGSCASGGYEGSRDWHHNLAQDSYAIADAMLKERVK